MRHPAPSSLALLAGVLGLCLLSLTVVPVVPAAGSSSEASVAPSGTRWVKIDLANEIIFKGIRVHGITGRRLFSTWYRLAGLFKAGLNIKPIITHTFPMNDYAKGFELINSGQCGKVVLFP